MVQVDPIDVNFDANLLYLTKAWGEGNIVKNGC